MRILLWTAAVIAIPAIAVLHAALANGGRMGALMHMILWSPVLIAWLIDRSIVRNRKELEEVRREITALQERQKWRDDAK